MESPQNGTVGVCATPKKEIKVLPQVPLRVLSQVPFMVLWKVPWTPPIYPNFWDPAPRTPDVSLNSRTPPSSPPSIAGGREPPPPLRWARRDPRTRKSLSARNPPSPTGPQGEFLLSNTSAKGNPTKILGFPGARFFLRLYFSI